MAQEVIVDEPLSARVWSHVWRIALAVAAGVRVWYWEYQPALQDPTRLHHLHALILADLLVLFVAAPVMVLRRSRPLLTVAVTCLCCTVSCGAFPLAWWAFADLAETRDEKRTRIGAALFMVSGIVNIFWISDYLVLTPPFGGGLTYWTVVVVVVSVFCILLYSLGAGRGNRRDLLESLRATADLARREQNARVAQAQLTERARIAREMHDVLAHRISLVSLHAGVLAYQDDLTEQERRETASLVQQMSHQALEELREVLGVLREDGQNPTAKPQPSLLDIPGLVAEEERAGSIVVLDVPDEFWARAASVGPNTARHAHRIIQESLTNARKHAHGIPVTVHVDGDEARGLDITVRNRRSTQGTTVPGAGLGLAGLRERVTLAGGSFDLRQDDTDFEIHAALPWNAKIGS